MGLNNADLTIIGRLKKLERSLEKTRVVEQAATGALPAPGAAGNFMVSDGVDWTSAPGGSMVLPATTARGDMVMSDAVPAWILLPLAGANDSLLTRNATNPEWSGYYLTGAAGKTLTFYHTVYFDGTDGKTLSINASLTLNGTDGHAITLTTSLINEGANGTLHWNGAYTLTVPEPMTVAGRDVDNTFTRAQIISATADEIQLTVSGHTTQTDEVVFFYTNDTTNNAMREVLRLETRNSGGVGAAGFGPGITFYAESATAATYRIQGEVTTAWTTATDATRTARLSLWNTDNAALYETFSLTGRGNVRVWYDVTNYTDFNVNSSGTLTITPVGDLYLDPKGDDILPVTGYDLNIGSLTKKFLTIHAAELWVETLVAQNTIATIGGRILVGPTTTIVSGLVAASTAVVLKHNQMRYADIGYLEANALVEFIRIGGYTITVLDAVNNHVTVATDVSSKFPNGSHFYLDNSTNNNGTWTVDHTVVIAGPSTEIYVTGDLVADVANGNIIWYDLGISAGPFYYPVITRDLDGSGANDWNAGDALFNTGTTGDGFIDLYSISSITNIGGGTDYGPTIVGNVRNSITYNDWTEHWAVGNLNGIYGYATDLYGVGLGKYSATGSYITIDSTNGVRVMRGAVERLGITMAGVMTIKDSAGSIVLTFDAAAGAEITKKLTMPGANSAIAIGATPPTSAAAGTGIWMDRTGIYGLDTNIVQTTMSATTGVITAGAGSVELNVNGIEIEASAAFVDDRAYKFMSGTDAIGGFYGSHDAGSSINYTQLWMPKIAGYSSELFILADCDTNSYIDILTQTDGGTTTEIYMNGASGLISFSVGNIQTLNGNFVGNENGGNYDFRIEGDTLPYMLWLNGASATENIALVAAAAVNWQTMDRGLFIGNMSAAPNANPTSGIFVYVDTGAGKARGTGGTVTTWAPAGPHCSNCGYDFWEVCAENEEWGAWIRKCGWCGKVFRHGPESVLHLLSDEQRKELVV